MLQKGETYFTKKKRRKNKFSVFLKPFLRYWQRFFPKIYPKTMVLFPTKIIPSHSFTNHRNCTTIPSEFLIKRKIRLVFAWWSVSRRRQANMALRRPSEHGDCTGGQFGFDSLQNFSSVCVSYSTWSLGFEKSTRFNGNGSLEYRLTVGNNDARRRSTLLLIRRSRAVERIAFATVHNTDTSKTRLYWWITTKEKAGRCATWRIYTSIQAAIFDALSICWLPPGPRFNWPKINCRGNVVSHGRPHFRYFSTAHENRARIFTNIRIRFSSLLFATAARYVRTIGAKVSENCLSNRS